MRSFFVVWGGVGVPRGSVVWDLSWDPLPGRFGGLRIDRRFAGLWSSGVSGRAPVEEEGDSDPARSARTESGPGMMAGSSAGCLSAVATGHASRMMRPCRTGVNTIHYT